MSGKHRAAAVAVIAVLAALLTFAVAGCSSSSSSSASGAASATATSSAVAKAKDQVNVCVTKVGGVTELVNSSKRTDFINCMQSLVPADKVDAFKSCITSAAISDQIWTSDGRTKFTNDSLPNCVNAATA
jgi:curli biogenesis system outer membrane secretion channel CsgG